MKSFLRLVFAVVLINSTSVVAGVIDPITGASGNMSWHSSPVGTDISPHEVSSWLDMGGHEHTITVDVDSLINVHIADSGGAGDAFALALDGVIVGPTSGLFDASTRGPSATAFFDAWWYDLFLSAGTHTLGLFVTDAILPIGGSPYSSVSIAVAVPEPSMLLLFGLGLAGLGFSRSRKLRS
jgi:hypothetical protein